MEPDELFDALDLSKSEDHKGGREGKDSKAHRQDRVKTLLVPSLVDGEGEQREARDEEHVPSAAIFAQLLKGMGGAEGGAVVGLGGAEGWSAASFLFTMPGARSFRVLGV